MAFSYCDKAYAACGACTQLNSLHYVCSLIPRLSPSSFLSELLSSLSSISSLRTSPPLHLHHLIKTWRRKKTNKQTNKQESPMQGIEPQPWECRVVTTRSHGCIAFRDLLLSQKVAFVSSRGKVVGSEVHTLDWMSPQAIHAESGFQDDLCLCFTFQSCSR